ncbi:hypothetical protein JKP88DRAFT_244885 [Tribonema minus]|uniref:Uncharacterized protein n=1 Tax=Tribonema minus TaxID=303371 RepID=A0A836CEY9_9STRA|nr:hypothetical protein JKP88DRAFT_244885 [Tribonema minus]
MKSIRAVVDATAAEAAAALALERKRENQRQRSARHYAKNKPAVLNKEQKRRAARKVAKHLLAAIMDIMDDNFIEESIEQAALRASHAAAARINLAQLESATTRALATDGFCVLKQNPAFIDLTQRLLAVVPSTINTAARPWENIFNTVPGTRCQLKLTDVGARSPYAEVKELVLHELAPLIDRTLMGLSHKGVYRPALLLSKMTSAADAMSQGPHRDWPLKRLKTALRVNDGFPVGVLMSLHDNGKLHLWPRSFDATHVNADDRITITLNAGDIIIFHGALVHEGAGYIGEEGEYHLRLHFYTQSTRGANVWQISNETEHASLTYRRHHSVHFDEWSFIDFGAYSPLTSGVYNKCLIAWQITCARLAIRIQNVTLRVSNVNSSPQVCNIRTGCVFVPVPFVRGCGCDCIAFIASYDLSGMKYDLSWFRPSKQSAACLSAYAAGLHFQMHFTRKMKVAEWQVGTHLF